MNHNYYELTNYNLSNLINGFVDQRNNRRASYFIQKSPDASQVKLPNHRQ